jgi:serine/threonine protein kinase
MGAEAKVNGDRDKVTALDAFDPTSIGPFRLLGRIGVGGMGVVYLGETTTGQRAAVKVVRPELKDDPAFRLRFAREIAAARRVASPVTAAIVDADPDGPTPWVAFEYVDAPTLAQVVREGPPRLSATVGILTGVAEALVAIHAVDIVHRDLKPSNVLVPPGGVKVIDFGISAALDATAVTGSSMVIGTPSWFAPEQFRGERVTPAADVFAWGMLAVYTATGHHPFGDADMAPHALMYRILNDPPDTSALPEPLRAVCADALAKAPQERPSAAELVHRLLPASQTATDAPTQPLGSQATVAQQDHSTVPYPYPSPRRRPATAWGRVWLVALLLVLAGLAGGIAYAVSRSGKAKPSAAPHTGAASAASTRTPTSPPSSSSPPTTVSTPTGVTSGTRAVLAPATIPPVVNECSQQLSFGVDGDAAPLTCVDGSLNAVAWAYFAKGNPTVMSLGPDATPSRGDERRMRRPRALHDPHRDERRGPGDGLLRVEVPLRPGGGHAERRLRHIRR